MVEIELVEPWLAIQFDHLLKLPLLKVLIPLDSRKYLRVLLWANIDAYFLRFLQLKLSILLIEHNLDKDEVALNERKGRPEELLNLSIDEPAHKGAEFLKGWVKLVDGELANGDAEEYLVILALEELEGRFEESDVGDEELVVLPVHHLVLFHWLH